MYMCCVLYCWDMAWENLLQPIIVCGGGAEEGKIPSHITPSDVLEKQIVLGIEKSQAYSALINSCQKAKCKTRNTPQMSLQYHHLWHLKACSRRHQIPTQGPPNTTLVFSSCFFFFFFFPWISSWFNATILSHLYSTTEEPPQLGKGHFK